MHAPFTNQGRCCRDDDIMMLASNAFKSTALLLLLSVSLSAENSTKDIEKTVVTSQPTHSRLIRFTTGPKGMSTANRPTYHAAKGGSSNFLQGAYFSGGNYHVVVAVL
jgi:hypothetical protein